MKNRRRRSKPLWIEFMIVGPIGIDVGRLQPLHPLLPGSRSVRGSRWAFPSSSHCRVTVQADMHAHLIELKWTKRCDVSHKKGIGHNISSAGNLSANQKGNAPFWLRKQIWGICCMAWYTSVCGWKNLGLGNINPLDYGSYVPWGYRGKWL